MAKLQDSHIFSGMQRDVSVSKHPAQFLYDGLNVRLTARESDTLLSISNEKGTFDVETSIQGTYLGHCMLNQYLVVFSHSETKDYIYRIDLSKEYPAKVVLYGNAEGHSSLGFSAHIDAIASYESKTIQKVYWTDGINQPRIINIAPEYDGEIESYNSTSFDFIPTLKLEEEVVVQKLLGTPGEFAPGVIQYAFTYYNKYGQESNIFYTTPLYYISYPDRGGSPEDKISNAFKITIKNVDDNFDFLRIYSIQRTSINATPFCKRVQDMLISEMSSKDGKKYMNYTDTGTNGDSIDPTELLYKGGERIIASTIEQKDNTLFLGGISISRESLSDIQFSVDSLEETRKQGWFNQPSQRSIYMKGGYSQSYSYANQLTAFTSSLENESTPCSGFKRGNVYRCGIQFQHITGKWSEPIFITDVKVTGSCSYNYDDNSATTCIKLPCIKGTIPASIITKAYNKQYRKVRPVVVFPEPQDRNILCQGVIAPTVYTNKHDKDNNPKRQSSWFFRPYKNGSFVNDNMTVAPASYDKNADPTLQYCERNIDSNSPVEGGTAFNPVRIREVEIQGSFENDNKFKVSIDTVSMHSPDITFGEQLAVTDFSGMSGQKVGDVIFTNTLSDIDIQTETPTIGSIGSGFVHKTFNTENSYGIGAGLYYDDSVVDENGDKIEAYNKLKQSGKWLVYPWQGTGSLNNDINRPADKGVASAKLKKKVISNLRYASTEFSTSFPNVWASNIQLFSSDEVSIVKLGDDVYQGNIDTSITPDFSDGVYLALESLTVDGTRPKDGHWEAFGIKYTEDNTEFNSTHWLKTWSLKENVGEQQGLRIWYGSNWAWLGQDVGDDYIDFDRKKLPVRMKYKSTPHLVFNIKNKDAFSTTEYSLPIVEITQNVNDSLRFGGRSKDARMANNWVPCGKPKAITENSSCTIEYSYGDTYFQRYDCLKTYPFTPEDLNQIVEIGSFMLESYINIDGRYDRNRGQLNNLNMTPQNFNLINPVYSQTDNFFTYKILDEDYYINNTFPNQITWTKEKSSGADVDLWTNITLASTYDMDGSKGEVVSLNTWKDQIFCFQNKGVSNILFNSRVQIPVSDGVPIEISNNYKVDGYKYLSDGIGCNDKWLIKETSSGIYFVDSVGSHLLHIGDGGLQDLSEKCNMTTWFKDNAGSIVKTVFDDINHDVYLVQGEGGKALCFSEKLGQFTGFYDYDNINLIETYNNHVFTMKDRSLWRMFDGEYCNFFGTNKPWSLTFISNGGDKMTLDKIFTNLEFRACVEGEGSNGSSSEVNVFDSTFDFTFHTSGEVTPSAKYTPYLPMDYLETWDEYQHGIANLSWKNGHSAFLHHTRDKGGSLKRKFRIWRCDIPRDNVGSSTGASSTFDDTFDYTFRGGKQTRKAHPNDRMRNPWLFIKLQKNAAETGKYLHKTELHDLMVTYFG